MDPNPLESVQPRSIEAATAASQRRLNACVAVIIALLAISMRIFKVKDDNIVQTMQQAQANKLDHWNF